MFRLFELLLIHCLSISNALWDRYGEAKLQQIALFLFHNASEKDYTKDKNSLHGRISAKIAKVRKNGENNNLNKIKNIHA